MSHLRAGTHHVPPDTPRRRLTATHPVVIALALVVWLVVGALGGQAQGSLSSVQENDQAAYLPSSAESTRAAELAAGFRDTSSLPALVVVTAGDEQALSEQQAAQVQAFAESVADVPLAAGTSLGDVLTAPVVAVPSEDGEAMLVPVSIDATRVDDLLGGERVLTLVVDELRALAADELGGDVAVQVSGPAGFTADLVTAFGGIDGILLLVALIAVLIILVFVYRSPVLPFAVLLTAVFALGLAALVVKPLAGNGVLTLNGQSQGIMSILVVGAATDYALLLVARYREELTRHAQPAAAMRAAWRAALPPIAASGGTVIVGLLCLLLSDLKTNSSLGPVAATGIASAMLATLTLLPAMLLLAGRRSRFVFWPRIPARPSPDRAGHDTAPGEGELGSPGWRRVAGFVARNDRRVWLATAAGLLVLVAFVPTLRAHGTGEADVFLAETESVTGERVLAEHFDVGTVQPMQVFTGEDKARDVAEAVRTVVGVESVAPVTDAQGGAVAPGGQGQGAPLVVDGRVQLDVVTTAGADTQAVLPIVADVRAAAQEQDRGALVGGAAAERLDTQDTSSRDLRVIIPVVLLVIGIMLALLLRAILAPLLLIVVNVLSFAATMGLSAIVFNHVLGFPGADANVPLYGFVFLVALGIDYSIFLLTRVREESLHVGTREGVRRGLAVTGGVITSAGLVLAATFSALAVIQLLFLVQLAFIVAVGVLIDTFIVRTLLVAGLVHDVGRATWWPWQSRIPRDGPAGARHEAVDAAVS